MPRARKILLAVVAVVGAWLAGCDGGNGRMSLADAAGGADGAADLPTPADGAPHAGIDAAGGVDRTADGALESADRTPDAPADTAGDTAADTGPPAADASDGPPSAVTSIEAYCRRHAERFCAGQIQCAPQAARSTESDCVQSYEALCLETARAWQIPGVEAGRVAFDATAAAACLDGSDKGPCGLPWTTAEACRSVFRPMVPTGGRCLDDGECLGGICDRRRTCPGVCASRGQPGDDCSSYPCDSAVATCELVAQTLQCRAKTRGMACRPYTDDCAAVDYCRSMGDGLPCDVSALRGQCTCEARAALGAACKLAVECAPGLGCAAGQCRTPVSRQGEPCSHAQGVGCAAGLACIIVDGRRSALSGTCGPMLGDGSPCYFVECQRGLDCAGSSISETAPVQGTCRPKAQPSGPCRPFGCSLGYYCEQGVCTPRPGSGQMCTAIGGGEKFCFGPAITCNGYTRGTCTAPPAVGQPCGEACDADGYCDAFDTGTCLRKKPAGQRCLAGRECASGTCSLGVCAVACTAASL